MRFSELGTVYRHERSGVLHGIFRPRGFTQDDSHIFCRPDQLVDEIRGVMDFVVDFYGVFGLRDAVVHLSTVDPKQAIGSSDMWRRAEEALREALDGSPFTYDVQEGEGAFYGPKIDFDYRDAIGRLHQLTTIQCDFALPEQFGLEYIGEDNAAHRPVMVHRALYGSVERFLGVYLEHTAGAFPPWIAPVQVRVIQMRDAAVGPLVAAAEERRLPRRRRRRERDDELQGPARDAREDPVAADRRPARARRRDGLRPHARRQRPPRRRLGRVHRRGAAGDRHRARSTPPEVFNHEPPGYECSFCQVVAR